jgi:hypothetical protein
MMYAVEMASCGMIYSYLPILMKIAMGVQFALRFCLRNLRCIIDGRGFQLLRRDVLRCHDTRTNFQKDWFRYSNLIGGMHTDTPSNIKVLNQKSDRLQYRYY